MDQVTPEIKLTIENALLTNNKVLTDEFDKSIDKKIAALSRSLNDQTQPYIVQTISLAKDVGGLQAKLNNIWGKFIGIAAALTVITALVTYIVSVIGGKQ